MADVVMGTPLGHSWHRHPERRLRARQGLDLALLIDREHDRALGRVQVEPDDVEDLLGEQRGIAQRERLSSTTAIGRPVRVMHHPTT
jgi:hypothetical protein